MPGPLFRFEPLGERHLALLREWLGRPHVAEWWGPPLTLAELREESATGRPGRVRCELALLGDEPAGFVQSYVAAEAGEGWWPDERDPGVVGIDLFLADPGRLGAGLGTALVAQIAERHFADLAVTRIQVDPALGNLRAIRCFEKAGFRSAGEVDTPDGRALRMVLRSPERHAPEHGFVRVDRAAQPASWVECLDALHREPFYRAYKERVRTLLAPRAGGLYLELGSGAGTDALALERACGARVIGIDCSLTMGRAARARGLRACVAAEAEALPLAPGQVDGAWSDRTFQHLADPRAALGELVRVLGTGATLVVVDPDYATQRMAFPDPALAQKVLDFRAHHALRNGTLAHAMARHFADAGLEDVSAEAHELVVEDPTAVDHVLGLRSWAATACARGFMLAEEVARWEVAYDELAASGRFRWSVSFFLTRGRKPERAC